MSVEAVELVAVEKIVVAYLKHREELADHVSASRISTVHPSSTQEPWVRIISAPGASLTSFPRVVVDGRVQIECYGGADRDFAQLEAADCAQAVAAVVAVIAEDDTFAYSGVTVVDGYPATEPWRLPDPDFTPERERYLFDASITYGASFEDDDDS